jgi:hypothetical protein
MRRLQFGRVVVKARRVRVPLRRRPKARGGVRFARLFGALGRAARSIALGLRPFQGALFAGVSSIHHLVGVHGP